MLPVRNLSKFGKICEGGQCAYEKKGQREGKRSYTTELYVIAATINSRKEDKRAFDAARPNIASLMSSIPQTAVHPALRSWFIWP